MNATAADWTHIEPLLDEAMHALDDTDRAAVLLRYFENKSLREVGATLGTSENPRRRGNRRPARRQRASSSHQRLLRSDSAGKLAAPRRRQATSRLATTPAKIIVEIHGHDADHLA